MLNLDTHILLFALQKTLTLAEERLLSRNEWSIPGIVLWEIAKLVQLNRIDIDSPEFTRFVSRLHVWPLSLEICNAIRRPLPALYIASRCSRGTSGSANRGSFVWRDPLPYDDRPAATLTTAFPR